MYKVILLLLVFNIPFIARSADSLKNNLPSVVLRAQQNVVSVLSEYGAGSGFIIRDDKNRAVLVTAYHVIRESMEKLGSIEVEDYSNQKLKIKRILSYSKMLDTVFLELENYDRKGLSFASSSSYDYERIFILGAFGGDPFMDLFPHTTGVSFDAPAKKTFNIMMDTNFYRMKGFSGGPALNKDGEIIGMLSGGHLFYQYMYVIKSSSMKNLLEFPKNKNSAVNRVHYLLHNVSQGLGNNGFLNRDRLLRLKDMADEGSENARKTLHRLDIGQFIKLGASIYFLNMFALGTFGLLHAEGPANAVFYSVYSLFFGSMSVNFCARAFTHFRNKAVSSARGRQKSLTPQ